MIGLDAAGARSLRYGTMADCVERLRVVFANGEVADLGRGAPRPDEPSASRRPCRSATWSPGGSAPCCTITPRRSPGDGRDRPGTAAGYAIHGPRRPAPSTWPGSSSGSEGTLALVAEATLRTVPIPAAQSVLLLPFGRLPDAAEAVLDCLEDGPSAVRAARLADPEPRPRFGRRLPRVDPRGGRGRADRRVRGGRPRASSLAREPARWPTGWAGEAALVADPVESVKRADCERLLGLRRAVEPAFLRLKRGRLAPCRCSRTWPSRPRPWPITSRGSRDPPRAAASAAPSRPTPDAARSTRGRSSTCPAPRTSAKLEPLAIAVHEAALACGGTVSGEHGCGLAPHPVPPPPVWRPRQHLPRGQERLRPPGPAQSRQGRRRRPAPDDPRPEGPAPGGRRPTAMKLPVLLSLARSQPGRDRVGLQRLRRVPHGRADAADVPELPGVCAPRPRRRGRRPTCSARSPRASSTRSSGARRS